MNRVNVGATIEQQRHHVCRSADDRTVQRMTASAVDVVHERWLLIEEGPYARQLAGFGRLMDRMVLGRGRRREPSRRINHVRGIILSAAHFTRSTTRRRLPVTGRPFVRACSTVRFPSAFEQFGSVSCWLDGRGSGEPHFRELEPYG